jgi:hypothetical protein
MTLVHDGTRTWIATPESGVVEHESRATRPIGEELLDAAAFLPGFDLAVVGETDAAGRRRLRSQGRRDRAARARSSSSRTAPTRFRSPSTGSAG